MKWLAFGVMIAAISVGTVQAASPQWYLVATTDMALGGIFLRMYVGPIPTEQMCSESSKNFTSGFNSTTGGGIKVTAVTCGEFFILAPTAQQR